MYFQVCLSIAPWWGGGGGGGGGDRIPTSRQCKCRMCNSRNGSPISNKYTFLVSCPDPPLAPTKNEGKMGEEGLVKVLHNTVITTPRNFRGPNLNG